MGGNSDFKNLETLSLHILSNTSFEDCGKVGLSSDFFNLVLKVFLCQKSYILTYLQLPIIFEISFVKAVCVDGLLAPHPIYHPIPFTHFQPPWCYIRLRRCYCFHFLSTLCVIFLIFCQRCVLFFSLSVNAVC